MTMCRNPFIRDGMAFGCGQCPPCRVNKRRVWTNRIMLESKLHPVNSMVTLTYDDDHLPRLSEDDERGILMPLHLKRFLDLLRKRLAPVRFRFYGVGEYGDDSWRPHYHLAMFNYPNCHFGQTRIRRGAFKCCSSCDLIHDVWSKGNVFLCELNDNTSQYVAQYVTKKMSAKDDPRLKGLPPEFQRMSLRPGIGHDAMWDVASTLLEFNLVEAQGDVPSALRHGSRLLPMGRYLTQKLRKMVGEDEKTPEVVKNRLKAELQDLRKAAFEGSRSFKKEIVQAADQAVLNMEARARIFKQRKDKL